MRLLLDENASDRTFVAQLRNAGHAVETTVSALGPGAPDKAIAAFAVETRRVLVTRDCDDFRIIYAQLPEHPGLILVYGAAGKAAATTALTAAVANITKTYATLDKLILALNDFFW